MSAPDRRDPPAPSPIRSFDFPEVRRLSLSNGLQLQVARVSRLPLVSTVLVLPTAEAAVDERRAGLAVLCADALEGGTELHTANELAEALESIGAALDTHAGWDATTVSLTCLPDRLPRALELLGEIVRDATFPEPEVTRARDQRLARIRQRAMDPSALANDRAVRLFYADGVPYGRPVAGTVQSVAALDREAVREFARTACRPGGSGFVMAGDVDEREAAAMLETHLAGWLGTSPPRPNVLATARFRQRTVHVVHRPGSVQSEIRVGHPGVPRSHADYFPLIVANTIFGGAFTSRLNLNLRERHGFTYGVRSSFAFRRSSGPFAVSTSVGRESTAAAVKEILSETQVFAREGPSAAEVEAARDYVAGVFPLRLETTAQIAGHLAESLIFGLPDDQQARFREHVRNVSVEAARDAAARHIRPAEATVVVVGDADVVRAPLEALDLGSLQVHADEESTEPIASQQAEP
jgi:zinc protease